MSCPLYCTLIGLLRFPDSQLQLHCCCIFLYPSVLSILLEHTDEAITFPPNTGIHLPADKASYPKSMKPHNRMKWPNKTSHLYTTEKTWWLYGCIIAAAWYIIWVMLFLNEKNNLRTWQIIRTCIEWIGPSQQLAQTSHYTAPREVTGLKGEGNYSGHLSSNTVHPPPVQVSPSPKKCTLVCVSVSHLPDRNRPTHLNSMQSKIPTWQTGLKWQ
jgi:hypothetical protein